MPTASPRRRRHGNDLPGERRGRLSGYGRRPGVLASADSGGPAERRRRLIALTAANLTANAGWNWAFFRGQSPLGGLAVLAVLDGLNAALVSEAARVDRRASRALMPYAAWCGFATALNASIWRHNR